MSTFVEVIQFLKAFMDMFAWFKDTFTVSPSQAIATIHDAMKDVAVAKTPEEKIDALKKIQSITKSGI